MKRLIAGLATIAATALLSGCYVSPDYSYVRGNGYQGSVYYGQGPSVIYRDNYYASPYYHGGYGCCWAPGVSVGGVWYGGHRYYRGRGYDWRDHHRWRGRPDGNHGHDRRRGNGSSAHGGGHHHDGHWQHDH
jgi:hypothetical protein